MLILNPVIWSLAIIIATLFFFGIYLGYLLGVESSQIRVRDYFTKLLATDLPEPLERAYQDLVDEFSSD